MVETRGWLHHAILNYKLPNTNTTVKFPIKVHFPYNILAEKKCR